MIAPFVQGFSVFVLAMSGYMWFQGKYGDMVPVKAADGDLYIVQRRHGMEEVANMLARMRKSLMMVLDHVKSEQGGQDRFCKASIEQLKTRFLPDRIGESPLDAEHTSYSVNKGERLFFCVRRKDRNEDELLDDNTLLFVGLHEMAHIMTRSVGHTPEFWSNFRFLLRVAIKHGVYKYQDFRNAPEPYCGITITDTPYHPGVDDRIEGPNKTQSCR